MFGRNYENISDEKLMLLIGKGRKKAFDELYKRYQTRLLAYFKRMLWQEQLTAEDFLQDLFMKLIEKPERYSPRKGPFRAWVFSVAHNMCKNEYRRREKRRDEPLNGSSHEIGAESNILSSLEGQEFNFELQKALRMLTHEQRHIFLLRYQENLSIKDISLQMQIPEGTVKSRIYYALRKLSRQLKDFEPRL